MTRMQLEIDIFHHDLVSVSTSLVRNTLVDSWPYFMTRDQLGFCLTPSRFYHTPNCDEKYWDNEFKILKNASLPRAMESV